MQTLDIQIFSCGGNRFSRVLRITNRNPRAGAAIGGRDRKLTGRCFLIWLGIRIMVVKSMRKLAY